MFLSPLLTLVTPQDTIRVGARDYCTTPRKGDHHRKRTAPMKTWIDFNKRFEQTKIISLAVIKIKYNPIKINHNYVPGCAALSLYFHRI